MFKCCKPQNFSVTPSNFFQIYSIFPTFCHTTPTFPDTKRSCDMFPAEILVEGVFGVLNQSVM